MKKFVAFKCGRNLREQLVCSEYVPPASSTQTILTPLHDRKTTNVELVHSVTAQLNVNGSITPKQENE